MSHEINPQHLPLDDLAQRCTRETDLYFKRQGHDSRYCFELFRRAIQGGDRSVWENIYPCYNLLVVGWVQKHPGFESSGEKVEYFVNGAFGKLSVSLTRERFSGFSDLESILRYLKMCVHSVIIDYIRSTEQANLSPLEDVSEEESADPSPEEQAMERSDQKALWDFVNARMNDEKEYSVVYGSFMLDLKPQELYDHFRGVFSDVDEVYRVKQNVLARLRRDPEFRKLLGGND
jgi:hypothetical protein